MILDEINEERSFFSLEEFQSKYNTKTRFLEYAESICKRNLSRMERKSNSNHTRPTRV